MFSKNVNLDEQQCQSGANWLGGSKGSVKQLLVREWGRLCF